jgi:[protein-PII] uridylyltransferase
MEILRQPKGITHAFRLMNQTSVLGRYLWVFRRIVGRMQHDLFHVYTVDQHILMVLRNVRRFFIPEHAHEYPFCSQLAAQWDKPWVLYVAALFHDVAKGAAVTTPSWAPPRCAASAATTAWKRERCAADRVPGAHHLTMSRIAQKEDLSDADVIAAFAQLVGTERRPDGAVPADGGRHPRHRPQGLERLEGQAAGRPVPADAACAGRRAAQPGRRDRGPQAGGAAEPGPALGPARHRRAAVEDAGGELLRAPRRGRHRLARALAVAPHQTQVPVVRARPPRWATACRCWCIRPDRPDLFARICGYFDSAGFSIQDAKVHTTRAGYALDTFQVVSTQLGGERRTPNSVPRPDLAGRDAGRAGAGQRRPAARARRGRVSRRVRPSRSRRASRWRPTSARSAGCSPCRPATARACCTPSRACWPATTSTCSWPRSARWASGSRTPSWSTARRCSSPRRSCASKANCSTPWRRRR